MTEDQKELFWEVLMHLRDRSEESVLRLASTVELPSRFCRFRRVSEHSLLQLQDNVVSFSSADHYDDPFDTYFSFNRSRIEQCLNFIDRAVAADKDSFIRDVMQQMPLPNGELQKLTSEIIRQSNAVPILPTVNARLASFDKLREQVQQRLFSICFCDNPCNEVLWLKYADNHRGFVQIYNGNNYTVLRCGEKGICANCPLYEQFPEFYPVCYTDEKYDATTYAIATLLVNGTPDEFMDMFPVLGESIRSELYWGAERISLRKKKCHKEDSEWRIICPFFPGKRPSLTMKPSAIALGLRMPKYEQRLVISAATIAGIESIYEMYINNEDDLAMRPITAEDAR